MDFKNYTKYFWATVFFGWAIIILIGSVMPTSSIQTKSGSESGIRFDYLLHLFVFTVLAFLFAFWRRNSATIQKKRELLWFLIVGSVYAGMTEGVQLYIDGRTFNPLDLMYNVLGVLTGTLLSWLFIMKPAIKREQI